MCCPASAYLRDFQVGRLDGEKPAVIRLSGASILEEHCVFDNAEGKVTLTACENSVTVRRAALRSGDL